MRNYLIEMIINVVWMLKKGGMNIIIYSWFIFVLREEFIILAPKRTIDFPFSKLNYSSRWIDNFGVDRLVSLFIESKNNFSKEGSVGGNVSNEGGNRIDLQCWDQWKEPSFVFKTSDIKIRSLLRISMIVTA